MACDLLYDLQRRQSASRSLLTPHAPPSSPRRRRRLAVLLLGRPLLPLASAQRRVVLLAAAAVAAAAEALRVLRVGAPSSPRSLWRTSTPRWRTTRIRARLRSACASKPACRMPPRLSLSLRLATVPQLYCALNPPTNVVSPIDMTCSLACLNQTNIQYAFPALPLGSVRVRACVCSEGRAQRTAPSASTTVSSQTAPVLRAWNEPSAVGRSTRAHPFIAE